MKIDRKSISLDGLRQLCLKQSSTAREEGPDATAKTESKLLHATMRDLPYTAPLRALPRGYDPGIAFDSYIVISRAIFNLILSYKNDFQGDFHSILSYKGDFIKAPAQEKKTLAQPFRPKAKCSIAT